MFDYRGAPLFLFQDKFLPTETYNLPRSNAEKGISPPLFPSFHTLEKKDIGFLGQNAPGY